MMIDEQGRKVSGAGQGELARTGIEYSVDHGDKLSGGKIFLEYLVEVCERLRGRGIERRERAQDGPSRGHEEGGRHALSGDIGQGNSIALVAKIDEIEPVACDGTRGVPGCFKCDAGDERHGLQKQRLLDCVGLGGFLLHAFALEALEPEEAGVLDGNGDVSGKRLKHLELVIREGVRLVMVPTKNAVNHNAPLEGKSDFAAVGD